MKPLVVDVAYPLMPQVDIQLDFWSFREQGGANVIGVEDEHPPVFTPLRNNLALFLNEAPKVRESHLPSLIDDLSDRHQIVCYCQDM